MHSCIGANMKLDIFSEIEEVSLFPQENSNMYFRNGGFGPSYV